MSATSNKGNVPTAGITWVQTQHDSHGELKISQPFPLKPVAELSTHWRDWASGTTIWTLTMWAICHSASLRSSISAISMSPLYLPKSFLGVESDWEATKRKPAQLSEGDLGNFHNTPGTLQTTDYSFLTHLKCQTPPFPSWNRDVQGV